MHQAAVERVRRDGGVLRACEVLVIIEIVSPGSQRTDHVIKRGEYADAGIDPEPIREHYVVIGRRRYPPKQVLAAVTGLDRGDFTTHQARSILRRPGFEVHRLGYVPQLRDGDMSTWPHRGAEAAALAPYIGRWIAQDGLEVLYEAESPYEVVRWLRKNGLRARVWRVPATPEEAGSMPVPAPRR